MVKELDMDLFLDRPSPPKALAAKGFGLLLKASPKEKERFAAIDRELFKEGRKGPLVVGTITFDEAQQQMMRKELVGDARYEVYARALKGQKTSPEQMKQIGEIVDRALGLTQPPAIKPDKEREFRPLGKDDLLEASLGDLLSSPPDHANHKFTKGKGAPSLG